MHDVAAWEAFFREALGLPFVLALVSDLDPGTQWSAAEMALANAFESPERRTIWLHGRSAVKRVLARLGEDTDTSGILFPAPRFSLSHCRFTAVVVGLPDGSPVEGIGVDLELGRTPPERSTRFFLTDDESKWVSGIESQNVDMTLLRLWTVKEALFKADPDNAGRVLTNYRLEDPSQEVGRAFVFDNGLEYASLAIPGGMLSVAVLPSASLP